MKKTLLAAALAFAATSANAGSTETPKMDVTVITQGAASSASQSWVVPAAFAALLIILFANLGGSSVTPS